MVKDLIKVMSKGTTRQQEFDSLSPEEKKKELDNYKPYFQREIPADIITDINSPGILDVILGSEEVGFEYNNGNENLLRFLFHAFIPKENDLISIGMTSSIKSNFFLPLVKADFVVNKALKEIDKLQPRERKYCQKVDDRTGKPIYDKNNDPVIVSYRVGWDVVDQKRILKNVMRSTTTLLLIKYIREFGIDSNLERLGVEKSITRSKNRYCREYYDLKDTADSKNAINETDNLFIENELQVIEKLKEVSCEKWPGRRNDRDIKGLYLQSKQILEILKIKLSVLEGEKLQPFKISDLDKITDNDTIVVSSYGVLSNYLHKLNKSKIASITNLKGSIVYKLKDIVDCTISHCINMYTLKNKRIYLSKEAYRHLIDSLYIDYNKLYIPSLISSFKPKHIISNEEIVNEAYQSYLRYKNICDWINNVFHFECIVDEDPFKKEYVC